MGVVVIVAVVALAGTLHLVQRAKRASAKVVDQWDGHVVAVIVEVSSGLKKYQPDTDSQFTTPILRRPDGREVAGDGRDPAKLPRPVREQIYQPTMVTNQLWPNFRLPEPQRRAAQEQARNGGHRFALPQPLPVTVSETDRGDVSWSLT